MFGETVDTLNMYLEYSYGSPILIWSLKGHQINKWQSAQYTLETFSPTRLWLEGTAGAGSTGDIALDDLVLKFGKCNPNVCIVLMLTHLTQY